MKKPLVLLVLVVIASFSSLVATASAEPDTIACPLEKKGLYHSPIHAACDDEWP
jgi:hypothetical protein